MRMVVQNHRRRIRLGVIRGVDRYGIQIRMDVDALLRSHRAGGEALHSFTATFGQVAVFVRLGIGFWPACHFAMR
jgi:hypothetical protein